MKKFDVLNLVNSQLQRVGFSLTHLNLVEEKYNSELDFWKTTLDNYLLWYQGDIKSLYGESCPKPSQKVKGHTELDSAVLTWEHIHQRKKYSEDLHLKSNAFKGMILLDVGSGPHPSALTFEDCQVYCLDPLLSGYIKVGFPIHYDPRAHFVSGYSENMPFKSNFFDAVISVNAIDHVDDFEATAAEIKRVLKPKGKLRLHVHYHPATRHEPLELTDQRLLAAFGWAKIKKIHTSKTKRGTILTDPNEQYCVWSNF